MAEQLELEFAVFILRPKSKYFSLDEMNSDHPRAEPCPAHLWPFIQNTLFPQMDALRYAWGDVLKVTPNGGYRTEAHHRALGNRNRRSAHLEGKAIDVYVQAHAQSAFKSLVMSLYRLGAIPDLSGLGTYSKSGFVHLDFGWRLRKNGTPRRWGK